MIQNLTYVQSNHVDMTAKCYVVDTKLSHYNLINFNSKQSPHVVTQQVIFIFGIYIKLNDTLVTKIIDAVCQI